MIKDCKNTKNLTFCNNELANKFCSDVRNYKVLTQDEERDLLKKMKSKNKIEADEARNKLIQCNQRFVISFARKFAREDNVMDLISEANIGLITALDNYDVDNNDVKLTTYAAHWMRRYLNEYLSSVDPMVVPANAQKLYTYANKARNNFWSKNQRFPTNKELQDILEKEYNVKISHIEDLNTFISSSIDESDYNDDELESPTMREFNVRTSNNNIDPMYEAEDLNYQVNNYLSILSQKERDVIKYTYGIGCDQMTNEKIGEKMGMCSERIRQIIKESENKLHNRFAV